MARNALHGADPCVRRTGNKERRQARGIEDRGDFAIQVFAGDRNGKLIGQRAVNRLPEGETDDFSIHIQVKRAKWIGHDQEGVSAVRGIEGCVVSIQGE